MLKPVFLYVASVLQKHIEWENGEKEREHQESF